MKKYFIFILLVIPLKAFAFRCQGHLISLKDSMSRVRQLCGEATLTDTRQKETVQRLSLGDERRLYVTIETWVYDLGSANLLQYVQFENKTLVKEWNGDFGGRSRPDPNRCDASAYDILLGQDQLEIRLKCGEPNDKNHLEDRLSSSSAVVDKAQILYPSLTTMVSVDEWIYDFGAQKSVTKLQFENGVLVRVLKKP